MACEHSVIGEFARLCAIFTPEKKRARLGHPLQTRAQINTRLKRKLYDTLFEFLQNKERNAHDGTKNVEEDVKTEITWYVLSLRKRRKFDEANRLETLLQTVEDTVESSSKFEVLKFLLLLKDSKPPETNQNIGIQTLPVLSKMGVKPALPEGPLNYGETRLVLPEKFHYMHYPSSVFETEPLENICSITKVCDQLPGCGLAGSGLFNVQGSLGDAHEHNTTHTLFGGLVHGRTDSLEVRLALPELPDDTGNSMFEMRIPKSISAHSMDDEGFKSQEESMTGSTHSGDVCPDSSFDSLFSADYDTSVYDRCLTEQLSQHYTWETVGLDPGPRTKPYLSHAGPEAFDHWNRHMRRCLKMAFPGIRSTEMHEISQAELVAEILNVMIAVPSMNFMLDMTEQCFVAREGLHVTGVSPEAMESLLLEFLTCGMFYYRLELFTKQPEMNSFYQGGLTFKAFTGAVQLVLQHYRGVILSVEPGKTLLQLRLLFHQLMQSIRFLATLCHCDNPVSEQTLDKFPNGIKLLSYLYNQTKEAEFTEHYPMMLSLLKHACTPYLIFVQEWVYHGVYRDEYGEFMIQVNTDYLQYKDKHYWTHGFTLATDRIEDSVPLFLKDLATGIFVCGKSINLLKRVDRNHFFSDIDDRLIPNIRLTFSETELRFMRQQCAVYASKMKEIARQATLSIQEKQERLERAKRDLIVMARRAAAKELQRLEDKMAERRRAVAAKKQKELQFLKQQMVDDIQRRDKTRAVEKQADKDYIDSVTNRELALDENELEIERQAREEVIAYYSQLTEEAARREQKALWRVRRAKLDARRTSFLLEQERNLQQELEQMETDPSSVALQKPLLVRPASPTSSLPRWAQKGLDGPTIQVDSQEEQGPTDQPPALREGDKGLSQWARKGLEKFGISPKSPSPRASGASTPSRRGVRARSPSPIPSGRRTPTRRSLNSSFHVNDETEEKTAKSTIQTYSHAHASKETDSPDGATKPTVKLVLDQHASNETTETSASRPHVKTVGEKHVTQQSELEAEKRPHIRKIGDMHANKLSDAPEHDSVPKLKLGVMHSTTESKPMEWKIKKQNVFGHVSELSNTYDFAVPKLKKSSLMSASQQSDWSTDFCIKPKIRVNKQQTANTESRETKVDRPRIKMSGKMSATKESEYVDYDQKRLQMFKERNIHGHATDSSVEKLLYDGRYNQNKSLTDGSGQVIKIIPPLDQIDWWTCDVEPYEDKFDFLDLPPQQRSSIPSIQYGGYGNFDSYETDIHGYEYLPLATVLRASVTTALQTQVSLVNECLVNYFLHDGRIGEHFVALRRYLCMADGDFSEILCDLLMDKLGTNPRPQDLLNPLFLNSCLSKAIRLSVNAEDKYADNVSFQLRYIPRVMEQASPDVFDCVQLHYEVPWPINIVITQESLLKYSQVFSFMLQLKRVVWVLKDVWHRLKRDALVYKLDKLYEFRELHLFRQEMQLFVKVMQEYISHQIVDVTWQEFQSTLRSSVHNLDDLQSAHDTYLENALFRCLLTKNAGALMKIIQDTFRLVLKFHRQLLSGSWQAGKTGVQTHRNYAQMKHTYKVFHDHSTFLFKVVTKLADRGYQPHLHDLLLRLNFNHYYDR